MKKLFPFFLFLLILASCQTQVANPQRPLNPNSIELYTKYTIQTNDTKVIRLEVLKQDDERIYGKLKSGEAVVIEKNEIYSVKKPDLISSLIVAGAAIAAVIFVPI